MVPYGGRHKDALGLDLAFLVMYLCRVFPAFMAWTVSCADDRDHHHGL